MTRGVPGMEPVRRLSLIDLVVLLIVAFSVWSDGRRNAAISTVRLAAPTLVPLATADAASAAHLLGQSVVGLVWLGSSEEPA